MTRRGLYFTQGGFWFRNNLYFNKGIKRRVGVKYNRLCFPLLVVKFAIDGLCITHDPKEIKKTLSERYALSKRLESRRGVEQGEVG